MVERKRLTKQDLLRKSTEVTYVYIPMLDAEVGITSLNDGQWAKVDAIRSRGMNIISKVKGTDDPNSAIELLKDDSSISMNLDEVTRAFYDADVLACSYGLEGNWSESEIKKLRPPGVVSQIAAQIYILSGVTKETVDDLRNFRDDIREQRDQDST